MVEDTVGGEDKRREKNRELRERDWYKQQQSDDESLFM